MTRTMLKSKIHRARVTNVNLDYEGSISIDKCLIREAGLLKFEQVEVLNLHNGARFRTYVIEAPEGSGRIELNGAAARLAQKKDTIIIVAYCQVDESELEDFATSIVQVDQCNHIVEVNRLPGVVW